MLTSELNCEIENMPKHKEYYEVSKEQARYMRSIKVKRDHWRPAEPQRNPSEAVNIEFRVEARDAITTSGTVVERSDLLSAGTDRTASTRGIYENLPYHQQQTTAVNSDFGLNKNLILNKFFRSTERNYAAYENLCSGCGYGVFEARGRLCNFCQYVVHGGYAHQANSWQEDTETNGNIYENICDKCAGIFSSEECDCCQLDEAALQKEPPPIVTASVNVNSSLACDEVVKCKPLKLKRDKKSLFLGLIGSLRRVKSNSTPPQTPPFPSPPGTRKRPEIVHNVDGFDNVFRTQESFDLDKICELKRSQNSSSDQHIYGRLKQRPVQESNSCTLPVTLSQSHDRLEKPQFQSASPKQVASADCLVSLETGSSLSFIEKLSGKRQRISKPRLLRPRSQNKSSKSTVNCNSNTPIKQSLYLADNVCQWMTSLRHEIHYYNSFGLGDDVDVCDPKSVPAKQSLIYARIASGAPAKHLAPALSVTNNNDPTKTEKFPEKTDASDVLSYNNSNCDDLEEELSDSDELVTLRQTNRSDSRDRRGSPVALTFEQRMVQDFMRNVMSKQNQQQRVVSEAATTSTPSTTTRSTAAAASAKTSPISAQQRAKRQAIYLKLDDTLDNSNESANNNKSSNSNIKSDAKLNYSSQEQSEVDVKLACQSGGLASRRVALQPVTASSKRCGIYERDSEFVNDILSAFEHFLQRETEAGDQSAADVAAKHSKSSDQSSIIAVEQSEVATLDTLKHESEVPIDSSSDHASTDTLTENLGDRVSLELSKYEIEASLRRDTEDSLAVTLATPTSDHRVDLVKILNVPALINHLLLSRSLNSVVVCYDKRLSAFLRCLHYREVYRQKYSRWTPQRLVRKYQRFFSYCERSAPITQEYAVRSGEVGIPSSRYESKPVSESVEQKHSRKDISSGTAAVASSTESEVNNCAGREVKLESVNGVQVESVIKEKSEHQNQSSNLDCERIEEPNNRIEEDEFNIRLVVCQINKDPNEVLDDHQIKVTENVSSTEVNAEECSELSSSMSTSTPKLNLNITLKELTKSREKAIKPKVPLRDPSTCISEKTVVSPPRPAKLQSQQTPKDTNRSMMTIPTANDKDKCTNPKNNNNSQNHNNDQEDEEGIYQPIWKFKTVGEVQERYHTDVDYYDFKDGCRSPKCASSVDELTSPAPTLLISNDVEDQGEWETDDEFMFTTQLDCGTETTDACSLNGSTVRSMHSSSSITGSTVTGYASTITIASGVSTSLMHHLFRCVGIFYSLSEPKLRAIIYDYDRVYAAAYFAKQTMVANVMASTGGVEKSPNDVANKEERSPVPPPRTSSATKTKAIATTEKATTKAGLFAGSESDVGGWQSAEARSVPKLHLLPDSVQAWKFMLLDVNYVEDEEDMIVSEAEILRAQEQKDDADAGQYQQLNFVQRFKSASIGNLIDIPTDEEKKSIAERMRNKLQRGVFKLNARSPKSEKKSRGIFRRAEATSLYLEDGMRPKYPIFGAPLDQLELNQSTQPNVPRFVVDCVKYIERQDCIQQDGLYRASGNKVSVDELKQKLCDSYIYDPKLLVCDDIHTLTSLLKQFFRELGAPLIPQNIYARLGRNFNDDAAIEALRDAFDEMPEPNRSTLKFLIKHLTNVACHSSENRMPASNLAIVWGPCLLSANQIEYDIARMNTLAKVLIENHSRIFTENERLVS